jgi:hypothetical protein
MGDAPVTSVSVSDDDPRVKSHDAPALHMSDVKNGLTAAVIDAAFGAGMAAKLDEAGAISDPQARWAFLSKQVVKPTHPWEWHNKLFEENYKGTFLFLSAFLFFVITMIDYDFFPVCVCVCVCCVCVCVCVCMYVCVCVCLYAVPSTSDWPANGPPPPMWVPDAAEAATSNIAVRLLFGFHFLFFFSSILVLPILC